MKFTSHHTHLQLLQHHCKLWEHNKQHNHPSKEEKLSKPQLQIHLQLTNPLFKGRSEFQFSSQCKLNRTIFCITEAELNMWLEGAP